MRITVALLLAFALCAGAQARMYQWVNPANGRVQLAGQPPGWYRGADVGPRVLVFENGTLVDDTALPVGEAQRQELRAAAFGGAADAADGAVPDGAASVLPDTVEAAADDSLAPAAERADPDIATPPSATADSAAKAAELKALIDAWDERQLEQARALLDLLPEAPPGAAGGAAAAIP